MNHQVEHDVDVQTARAELAHAVDLEEKRRREDRLEREDSWIEPFQVTDLQNSFLPCGAIDEAVCVRETLSNRFLDQDVQAKLHQAATDIGMSGRRRSDNGCVGIPRGF